MDLKFNPLILIFEQNHDYGCGNDSLSNVIQWELLNSLLTSLNLQPLEIKSKIQLEFNNEGVIEDRYRYYYDNYFVEFKVIHDEYCYIKYSLNGFVIETTIHCKLCAFKCAIAALITSNNVDCDCLNYYLFNKLSKQAYEEDVKLTVNGTEVYVYI